MMYKPVKGSRLTEEQAQRYGERIGALIEENNGQISPQAIIRAAKPKRSPMHDFFEWDDTEAANLYRLNQAGYLLRSIQVVVRVGDNEEEVRAFHSVTITNDDNESEPERAYVQIDRVLAESELKEQVIEQALRALISWKRKYQQYTELISVV